MLELEFLCGTIVKNTSVLSFAISKHIQDCKDINCIEDCKKDLSKYKNIILSN